MKEALQITEEPTAIRIQVRSRQTFDLSVFSQTPQPDLYLECSAQNSDQGWVEYSTDGLISLEAFVREIELDRTDSCAFLFALFSPLAAGLKNQPVILDSRTIFLSPKGDRIYLLRAPVVLEVWMKRQEEIEQFLLHLMEILPSDSLEIFGLLWKGIRRHLRFDDLLEDLRSLYRSSMPRKLFSRKQAIPAYRSRKAVFTSSKGQIGSKRGSADLLGTQDSDQWAPVSGLQTLTSEKQPDEESVCFEPVLGRQSASARRADHFEPWQDDLFTQMDESLFSDQKDYPSPLHSESVDQTDRTIQSGQRFPLPASARSLFEIEQSPPAEQPSAIRKQQTEGAVFEQAASSELGTDPGCTLLLDELELSDWLEIDGQQFTLAGEEVLAGRGASCTLQLSEPSVSSKHARLLCQQGRWYIQDLKSTNGTWLNEKRVIRRMRLREGMVIRFGNRTAVFHEQSLHDR